MCNHERIPEEILQKKEQKNKCAKENKCANMKEYKKKTHLIQKEKEQKGRKYVHAWENVGRKETQ